MSTFRQEREFQKLKQQIELGLKGIAGLVAQLDELDARGDLDERTRAATDELRRMVKDRISTVAARVAGWKP